MMKIRSTPEPAPVIGAGFPPMKRPFGVTLLLWLVLSLSVWGAIRLSAASRWWDVLLEKEARLSPLYLSITGAGWAVAGIVLLAGIWLGRRWTTVAIPAAVVLWLIQYWVERLFFQAPRANLPFMVIVSAALLMVTLLSTFNRKSKNFLGRSEEYEQPKQDSTAA